MHPHRTSAPTHDNPAPLMGAVLAFYATAYFATGVPYNPRLHALLAASVRAHGAQTVAERAREICTRIAAGEEA